MILNETYTMNNSITIPKVALGTWLIDDNMVTESVRRAIKIGYRHIDTAQAYGNEHGVGEAIRTCGLPRESIFVTSKIAAEHKTYQSALASIYNTLETMRLDYIDMMLIHSPQPWAEVNKSSNRYLNENLEVWNALQDAISAKKVKTIGVSNFLAPDLENILNHCKIKPAVNQILAHISNTPFPLIDYCKKQNILVEAYSPIAHGEILKNEKIVQIAKKYNVTVPQICLRYCLQLGMVVLPKTSNPEHMHTNTQLDFSISDDDMIFLKNIEHIESYGESSFFPVFGGKL